MDDKLNKNEEINEALGELNLKQVNENSPEEVARKAQEAFREFEMKQQRLHQKEKIGPSPETEIAESIKEFEVKSAIEEQNKKPIEDPNIPKDATKMARFVIKFSGGLVREQRQAEYVLLGVAILVFLTSGYLFFIGISGNNPKPVPVSPEMLEQMNQLKINRQNTEQ